MSGEAGISHLVHLIGDAVEEVSQPLTIFLFTVSQVYHALIISSLHALLHAWHEFGAGHLRLCSLLPFDLDLTVASQHAMLEDRTTATNLMLRQVISVLISVISGRGKVEPGLSATINQKKEPLGRTDTILPKVEADPQRSMPSTGKLPTAGTNYLKKNLVVLDVSGFSKVFGVSSTLYGKSLESFPGFEDAVIAQFIAGTRDHSAIETSRVLYDKTLKVGELDYILWAGIIGGPSKSNDYW